MSNAIVSKDVYNLGKLARYNQGSHDQVLNPLTWIFKLAAVMQAKRSGATDSYAIGLHKLSNDINNSRFILRFFLGVSQLDVLLNKKYMADPLNNADLNKIRKYQSFCMLLYNPCELLSYLQRVAPELSGKKYDGPTFGGLSCLFLFCTTMLEFYAIWIKSKALQKRKIELIKEMQTNKTPEGTRDLMIVLYRQNELKYELIANACDSIMAYNWTKPAENQFMGDLGVGVLGTIGANIRLWRGWVKP